MWLGYQNGKITHVAISKLALLNIPLVIFDKIEETKDNYILVKGKYIKEKDLKNEKIIAARKLEYPSIEDQLDMLYWDKINGTNIWENTISRVKKRYPKK